MAYRLVVDEYYEPEAETYRGEAEVLTAEFWGPPEFPGLELIVKAALDYGASIRGLSQLRTRIWMDPMDWYNSKIKIEATAHDSPIAPAVWIGIVAALAAIAGIVLITYFISKTDWPKAGLPLTAIGIGLAAVAAVIYFSRRGK